MGESITQATSSTQQLLADKVAPDYWVPNADIKVSGLLLPLCVYMLGNFENTCVLTKTFNLQY